MFGLSERTLQRAITRAPIVTLTRGRGGEKATHLRLGHDLKKIQDIMSHIGRKDRNRPKATPHEYGFICGMAQQMPHTWQVRIFEHALSRWDNFMAMLRLEIETALIAAEHDLFAPEAMANPMLHTARRFHGTDLRDPGFLNHPNIRLLRVFHHVATDLFITDMEYDNRDAPTRLH